ncbi:MAG: hypothetical protein ACREI2_07015, partial [Nitrospiraceae bacterium]
MTIPVVPPRLRRVWSGRAAPTLGRLPLLVSPSLPYDSASSPAALDADLLRASYLRRHGNAGSLSL